MKHRRHDKYCINYQLNNISTEWDWKQQQKHRNPTQPQLTTQLSQTSDSWIKLRQFGSDQKQNNSQI